MDSKLPAWLLRDNPPRKAAGYAKPWSTDERKVPAWVQKRAPRLTAVALAVLKVTSTAVVKKLLPRFGIAITGDREFWAMRGIEGVVLALLTFILTIGVWLARH